MTMTDPIADMLTRLRNANQAYHDAVTMPYSKLKRASPRSSGRRATSPPSRCRGRGRVGKTADDHPQVRPEPGALHRGHPPDQQAGPARVREGHRAAQGARWPRRRDHLDQPGSADRPPGQPEGRGWGSPRLRLVTDESEGATSMSRIGRLPIAVPSGVDVDDRRPPGDRQGPQGHAQPHHRPADHGGAGRGRASRSRVPTTSGRAAPCTG